MHISLLKFNYRDFLAKIENNFLSPLKFKVNQLALSLFRQIVEIFQKCYRSIRKAKPQKQIPQRQLKEEITFFNEVFIYNSPTKLTYKNYSKNDSVKQEEEITLRNRPLSDRDEIASKVDHPEDQQEEIVIKDSNDLHFDSFKVDSPDIIEHEKGFLIY